uniref:Uncharacterized protein n=1 Tax=Aquila chrysaetos chrysaetos TaxID=223781 RepID=A0A663EZH7_AQUCH
AGQYIIITPDKPVIGVIGKGVILPCQLNIKIIPERLLVQWVFTGHSKKIDVITYGGKNADKPVYEDETYQGRTNIFWSEFNKGDVSLHLKNVTLSDKGKYTCSVFFENWYDEAVVDLDVAGKWNGRHLLLLPLSIFLDGPVGQGIGLTCKSQGWLPEPKVVWLNSKGQTRKEEVTTQSTKTSSGVFDVVSSMILEPGSDKEVSCRVVNNLLNATCESRVLISVPITVDENTAHPNLSIAVDKKSFTHKSEAQKVTQNEESFDSFVCVLGLESFSSGKHYWEVDVEKSNDWDLGVARKSAPRKGIMSLSPEEGFWALGFSFKCYWARTEPWTRLAVQRNPRRVGVYLNCEEKILTFFNVTDMSVMFTFKDCAFSEEVYPFFKNSHKESTMRICSVQEE